MTIRIHDSIENHMETITLITVLLVASSLFMLAYVSIDNYFAVKKLDKNH